MFSGPVDEPSVREAIEDEGYEVIAIGAAPA
jgi:hypothetical protein